MAVDPSYMQYGKRRPGMDHDLYPVSYLPDRKPVSWPDGKHVAVWIVPILEFFPLDMKAEPINPPGGMTRPYPDYWNYTLDDYGNRVGIYRILEALQARGMKATTAFNARLADHYPQLMRDCVEAGSEIVAHGWDMGTIHGDYLPEEQEKEIIKRTRGRIGEVSGAEPEGWLAPAMALSRNTTRLVAEAGFRYTCDWVNDELPFAMTGDAAPLVAMPLGYELSDLRLMLEYRQMAWEYGEQVTDALKFLVKEARDNKAGRVLALPLHPWLAGAPHRIGAVEQILDQVANEPGCWVATGAEILNAWETQQ